MFTDEESFRIRTCLSLVEKTIIAAANEKEISCKFFGVPVSISGSVLLSLRKAGYSVVCNKTYKTVLGEDVCDVVISWK